MRYCTLVFVCVYGLRPQLWAEEKPTFYRGINLNGPALTIDGNSWESDQAKGFVCNDARFENQTVRLTPATDKERARMLRSSRYSQQLQAQIRLTEIPNGVYSIYLYIWEDNDPQTVDIQVMGKDVAPRYNSGSAGHWDRLGPWIVEVTQGFLELTAKGGHANLSGLEVWRGRLQDGDHPLPQPVAIVPPKPTQAATAAVLIARNCLECHNSTDSKGGLDLTRRAQALKGGDSGAAIVPGNPNHSLLMTRVTAGQMPPKGRTVLTESEQILLRDWIRDQALWAADPIDPFLYTSDRRAGYNWWSLQPLTHVPAPVIPGNSWIRNPIDQFVLQKLQAVGLEPSGEADRRTLIRRLSFDLLGLPPTPEEVDAFMTDSEPLAYERLVERLLESPHYGERWARHWLDIVRYAESQGFERNKLRPNAWKYRDFVVEAFNSDLPYDDFVRLQIAGDVLVPGDPLAAIASGFLTMGPYDLTAYTNGTPDMQAFAREEELEGLVGTVGQTFLGLTINCSRCHDHKFDPISQREFYQFSAALAGTYQGEEREGLGPSAQADIAQRTADLLTQIGVLLEQEQSASEAAKKRLIAERSRLEGIVRLLKGGPVHTTVPKQPGPWHILARGDFRHPGEEDIQPRGIASVAGVSPEWKLPEGSPEGDRRKALANWLVSSSNPLTPRVIVNRLWGYHFGEGLVRTPSDFGFQGGLPSHPELLDWLAGQLIHPAEGTPWRLKSIQRLIVNSATYRQSSASNFRGTQVDAENRLLWRYSPQRLDAESFRDTVLSVSGELNPQVGGPGFRDFQVSSAGNNETYTVFDAVGPEYNRRSLYRCNVRSGTSPLLDTLDCPDPSVATPRRSVTSTPLQALTLLNDIFPEHYAKKFAERLLREFPNNQRQRVQRAYMLAFARQPTDDEVTFALKFISHQDLVQFCIVLFNTSEFLYVD